MTMVSLTISQTGAVMVTSDFLAKFLNLRISCVQRWTPDQRWLDALLDATLIGLQIDSMNLALSDTHLPLLAATFCARNRQPKGNIKNPIRVLQMLLYVEGIDEQASNASIAAISTVTNYADIVQIGVECTFDGERAARTVSHLLLAHSCCVNGVNMR